MKILLTSDWYPTAINGVTTSINNLKIALENLGHEVKQLTLNVNTKSDLQENDNYAIGSLTAEKIYPNARIALRFQSHLVKELIEWHPDIVHSNCEFTTFPIAVRIARICNVPLIHTYHTVYENYTHYFSPSKRVGRRLVKLFSREVLEHVDLVIAPTEKISTLLKSYGVKSEIAVVPSGIDLSKMGKRPSDEWIINKKQELGILDKHIVLFLGRLAKEKNIDTLMSVSQFFNDDTVLLIVGGGPDYERLLAIQKTMKNKEKIIFVGMVPQEEVQNYYALGDVFSSASTSETQGLTYYEAAACGLPLICIADDCLDNIIIDGENGYQCSSTDELANKINKVLSDLWIKEFMSKSSIEIINGYSVETFGKTMEKLYNQLRQAKQLHNTDFIMSDELVSFSEDLSKTLNQKCGN